MPFVDSHCHINFPELAANIGDVLAQMRDNEVFVGRAAPAGSSCRAQPDLQITLPLKWK
jgi:Tat protein secretion system quality control protein TatD with DNase activity